MLKLKNISFHYDQRPILKNINLDLPSQQTITLLGLSGSGKTTLFKLITGILEPQEGEILLDGQDRSQAKASITYMMQEDLLLPWRTALANLTLTSELGPHPHNGAELKERALAILKELGLEGKEDFYPDELSGGMKQRLSIARALLQNRPWILLDEPFAALDVILREHMYELLRKIQEKYQKTILLITHDFRDALLLSDRIYLLDRGQIRKEWEVEKNLHQNPQRLLQLEENLREELNLCSL